MNKLLLLPVVLLAACTQVQGDKPVVYQASSADVLAAAAMICPTLIPNSSYRTFAVTSTTKTTVICVSKPVFAPSNFNVYDPVTLRIDATQLGTVSSVTASEDWGSTLVTNQNALGDIFAGLDRKFVRVR